MEEEDPESQMAALAEASQIALDKQDFGAAVAAMTKAIELERSRGNHVTMINLEMDLVPLLDQVGETKRKNALKRTVKKDRNDLFSGEDRAACAKNVPGVIAKSRDCDSMDATLDLLEAEFRRARAMLGDEHEATLAVRSAIAQVYFDDGDYDSAADELLEIQTPSFKNLRMLLECQIRTAGEDGDYMECYETLREMKQKFAGEKQHAEDIEKVAAYVLYKDNKLEEALGLYRRILARPSKKANDDRQAMLLMCAKVLLDLSKHDEGEEMIQDALKRGPVPNAWFLLAVSAFRQEKLELALQRLEEMGKLLAAEDVSGQITKLHLESNVLKAKEDLPGALGKLEQCVELCQKDDSEEMRLRKVYDDIGAIHHLLGDEDKVLHYYNLAHPPEEEEGDDEEEEEEKEPKKE